MKESTYPERDPQQGSAVIRGRAGYEGDKKRNSCTNTARTSLLRGNRSKASVSDFYPDLHDSPSKRPVSGAEPSQGE
jgi:hypothetical protein